MSEKRFEVFDDDFSKWIVDTYYTEDRHEHNLYDAYAMCNKLNELYEENNKLQDDIEHLEEENRRMAEKLFILHEKYGV